MKNTYIILLFNLIYFISFNLSAQVGFPYQAVVRDNIGNGIANKDIKVRFSVHQGNAYGTSVYREVHNLKTDASGSFSLEIGTGNAENGIFKYIDWSKAPYFVKTEVDTGNGYDITGTQELLNTPYSMFSDMTSGLRKVSSDGKTTWQLIVDDLGNVQVIPFPKGYSKLVFHDEFNGTGLPDPTKWGYEEGYVRQQRVEMQYYTKERLENTFQKDGMLHIRCIANDPIQDNEGKILNDSEHDGVKYHITSASVVTKGNYDWRYCRVEARVKLPSASGTWPAIWMLPTDPKGHGSGWPESGEIDILEYYGNVPNKFWYTAHFYYGAKGYTSTSTNATDWHVFALEWHEDKMEWYCDGRLYGRYKNPNTNWGYWPFDLPFYLLLNFAFGPSPAGYTTFDVTKLPLDYQIDYVRVFQ